MNKIQKTVIKNMFSDKNQKAFWKEFGRETTLKFNYLQCQDMQMMRLSSVPEQ